MYRGISDFKKGYQHRTTVVKDERGELVAHPHSIMARWRNYFSQLLNVHEVNIRQAEIHTVEPLVPEPSAFEFELAIEKLKNYKSPGIDQIPAELIKVGGVRFINLLFLFGIRRNCLMNGRSRSFYLSIRWGIKQIVITIGAYHYCQVRSKFVQYPAFKVNSICGRSYWGSSMWFPTQ